MTMVQPLMQAPYGDANFEWIRCGRYAYVDKTRFIEALEKRGSRCLFLVRPDGFGKSLFIETLAAYYDKAAASDFESNFAGTYIGAHRTEKASELCVVQFDFSGISPEHFATDFIARVKRGFIDFCQRYEFGEGFAVLDREHASATALWADFLGAFERRFGSAGGKLCVLIDEFDHLADERLSGESEPAKRLAASVRLMQAFGAGIKAEVARGVVDRVYVTGVTSLAQGLVLATDCSFDPALSSMFGFTENELRDLIPQVLDLTKCGWRVEDVLTRLKAWYGGYCFNAEVGTMVCHASMCLYYLDFVQRNHREPDDLRDSAFSPDLTKLEKLGRPGSEDFVCRTIERALQGDVIDFPSGSLQVLNLKDPQALDEDGLLSIMVYLGCLTFVPGNRFALRIPNRATGIQFFEYCLKRIQGAARWRCAARTPPHLYEAAGLRLSL